MSARKLSGKEVFYLLSNTNLILCLNKLPFYFLILLSATLKSRLVITYLILISLCSLGTRAGHLRSGYITYRCLNSTANLYEIQMTLFRDCDPSNISFDIDAKATVFDSLNNLIATVPLTRGVIKKVPQEATSHPCAIAPPAQCTDYTTYKGLVNLPPIDGGYTISWQRCCRNQSLLNISGAQNYGTTLTISIPSNDTLCNSAPQIQLEPLINLCVLEPVNFALDVFDYEGDSLSYRFCSIYAGGAKTGSTSACNTNGIVNPVPACPPPYNEINFVTPLTIYDPLPANPQLQIDPVTGVITGIPTQVGIYAVGICIDEFRDGKLLSSMRMDHQLVVSACLYTESDMVTPLEDPGMLCHGLTVNFTSECINTVRPFWDFGDTNTLADTSDADMVSYTYPEEGTYEVILIAYGKNASCGDTARMTLDVRNEIFPEFNYSGSTCFEKHELTFHPKGFYPPDVSFYWYFDSTASTIDFVGKYPPGIKWSKPGNHKVLLEVNYANCSNQYSENIFIEDLTQTASAGQNQTVRVGQTVYLNASGGNEYYWYANKPVNMSSRTSKSTSALMNKVDTVTFYVRISDKDNDCHALDSVIVYVLDDQLNAPINFFSPNGDGINDLFDISNINTNGDCSISIMNRWGKQVWWTDNYQNNWDGKDMGGNDLSDGTYYYILRCNTQVRYKAAITLMRDTHQ